jgi:hypothetical protein
MCPDTHSTIRGLGIFTSLPLALALLCTGLESSAAAAVLPLLPQKFIDTTYSPPSGRRIPVNAGDNLQRAIDNAELGDTLVLQAGATFTGPFKLPNKSGSGWIYIQSSAYANLPPPGTRVSIADAQHMPKIVGTAGERAIITNPRAHHYRFVGIEIRPEAGKFVTTLASIGYQESSLADLPRDITFDRCYVHGDPVVGGRRGIAMDGVSVAVVDSYISDFKEVGADSQALWTYNSPGPLKIVNNYLEAAAENFMSGGADPKIANLVPSDMEIRRNHFFKPLSWMKSRWSVKNLIEFKNARRILVEGNLFENIWEADQIGSLMNAKSVNQDGRCPWCVTQDLTFRYNRGVNLENGFQLGGIEGPAVAMNRVLIEHNVVIITRPKNGEGRIFQIGGAPKDMTIRHNTGLILVRGGATASSETRPAADRFDFRDNLLSSGEYGFAGTGAGIGTSVLTRYFSNFTFLNNAIIGGEPSRYPAGNFFPSNNAAVGFVNFAKGDYRLTSSSPFRNAATDNTDVGANLAAIAAASATSTTLPPPAHLGVK